MKKLEEYVRSIPDFPEPGIIFRDVTSVLQDADGLKLAIDEMAKKYPRETEAGGPMRKVGEKWIGKRVTDCIGLIKSYMWYNSDTGEITAGSNNFQDCNATSIWNYTNSCS